MRIAIAIAGAVLLAAALLIAPAAALSGWRALFVAASGVPIGAVTLLLIARATGAGWGAALLPLARLVPLVALGVLPLVAQQALFVTPPPHLGFWLWWPAFAARSLAAVLLWWWLGRQASRGTLSTTAAGFGLVAHGIVATILATDWLLGTAPAQPNSAIGMALAVSQILAACAAACLLRLGAPAARRDLARLMLGAGIGLAYLLFMDFLIIWYGDLPTRVGWYAARTGLPWALLAQAALLLGVAAPIAAVVAGRLAVAGAAALAGLLLAMLWVVGLPGAWPALAMAAGGALLLAAFVPRERNTA